MYKYGGIYADCDCICLKPFDVFVYCYDFFVGVFPPMFHTMKTAVFLQNCLIGSKAKHPIIKKVASLIVDNWEQTTYREDEFYTTIERTFLSLTLTVEKEIGRDNNLDIVMPPSYFFPITPYPIYDCLIRGLKETIIGLIKPELAPFSSFKKNSFSHHYSTKEWVKDIYSTMTLRGLTWTLFNLKDWKLFLQSKLFKKNQQQKIARQTFEELINR